MSKEVWLGTRRKPISSLWQKFNYWKNDKQVFWQTSIIQRFYSLKYKGGIGNITDYRSPWILSLGNFCKRYNMQDLCLRSCPVSLLCQEMSRKMKDMLPQEIYLSTHWKYTWRHKQNMDSTGQVMDAMSMYSTCCISGTWIFIALNFKRREKLKNNSCPNTVKCLTHVINNLRDMM